MKIMKLMSLSVFCLIFFSANLMSKTVEVKMLNKDSNGQPHVFEPAVVFIEKGDSVKFISVDKGHNVASMDKKGSAPAGVKKWKSKISKDHIQKFDIEGIHGIKCKPHMVMGMVGAVVVGNTHNIEAFSKVKLIGKAKKRFPKILATIKSNAPKGKARKTASVETSAAAGDAPSVEASLAQLKNDVDGLKAAVKDIQSKLEKLEAK
tara:strand:- start:3253 stop:3870 length:618 start_codon:yes stop_codon:yes gene_type:complete